MEYYEPLRHVVSTAEDGWKLRTVLQSSMFLSRQLLVRLKRLEQGILLNGERKYVDVHVSVGDLIEVRMPIEQSTEIIPQAMDIEIVFEDDHIAVVNKQAGVIVHPTHGHYEHTLANGMVYDWQQRGVRARFRPVQRLDQETSGLILIAKTPFAHQFVSLQLLAHTVKKEYVALVRGVMATEYGTIDAPIDRLPVQPHRRAVLSSGAEALTHYEVMERLPTATFVQLRLQTGRTHQIRVHLEHLGHPLIGDALYGLPIQDAANTSEPAASERQRVQVGDVGLARHALHAQRLGFVHPGRREWVEFYAALPTDMQECLERLRTADMHNTGGVR